MTDTLNETELFSGMSDEQLSKLLSTAQQLRLAAGEYLFRLGEAADHLYVVVDGELETCFPFTVGGAMRDVAVHSRPTGSALGWSALVQPHRFTLSARASQPSEIIAFPRKELLQVLDSDCETGKTFMGRLAEIIGRQLLTYQALWVREVQRAMAQGWEGIPAGGGA